MEKMLQLTGRNANRKDTVIMLTNLMMQNHCLAICQQIG